eukprot:jgi/Mesvir1/1166/Mv17668-RA.1
MASRGDHEDSCGFLDTTRRSLVWPNGRQGPKGRHGPKWGPPLCGPASPQIPWAFARRYRGLKHLNVAQCFCVTHGGLTALAQPCRDLRGLDVSNCTITDRGTQAVAAGCPNLLQLTISGCMEITDDSLMSFAQRCRQLEILYCEKARVSDDGIIVIARNCPRLSCLMVPACVTDDAIAHVADHCPSYVGAIWGSGMQGCGG